MKKFITSAFISTGLLATSVSAFSTPKPTNIQSSFDPLDLAEPCTTSNTNHVAGFAATIGAALVAHPLAALAEEADDYEYGAVNAPIGIAWAAGTALIATSLLPLALKGGEEAFEEMKEQDSQTWGKKNRDVLSGRGKKR